MTGESTARLRQTGSGRLSADEAARLPDRLLDAATEMFVNQGYGRTTMEGIAKRAGASTKTIYSRYRNKAEILRASIRRLADRTLPNLVDEMSANLDEADTREFLIELGLRIATMVTSKDGLGLYRLVVAERPRFSELARVNQEGPLRAAAFVRGLFERWQRNGRLASSIKPEVAALLYLDLVGATPRNLAVIGAPLSRPALQAHVAAAVDLFLNGCGPRDAATRGRPMTALGLVPGA
jgi:AcrR family transcriptional regulator